MTEPTATTVTLTGTGVPHAAPGRAGAGVLVRHGSTSLQFDAGRATVLRMCEAGVTPTDLTALFITHFHSDHVVDVVDVVLTRWIQGNARKAGPLPIVTPVGPALRFIERMLVPYDDDIDVRREHTGNDDVRTDIISFHPAGTPTRVWQSPDGDVVVEAVSVHHEPVVNAVAYRVTTPAGSVVISGDTRVCDEVFEMASTADLLVHEACRTRAMADAIKGTPFEQIFDYHADSVTLGEYAKRYSIKHLMLTHLIPAPRTDDEQEKFERDVRRGGFTGKVTVGRDLTTVTL